MVDQGRAEEISPVSFAAQASGLVIIASTEQIVRV